MLYVRADVHGNIEDLFESARRLKDDNCTKDDVLIICGDFGFLWWDLYNAGKIYGKEYQDTLDYQEKKLDRIEADFPCTVVFVDGNHENMPLINTYPLVQWNGAVAHMIRPHIYHICRGEILTLEGLKFFCFGGARSHDIRDGLLDAEDPHWVENAKKLMEENKIYFRTKNVDWWYGEFPSQREMDDGLARLNTADYKVDYIITHDCPGSIKHKVHSDKCDELNEYFNEVYYKCFDNLKMWYFGHYHANRRVDSKATCLYNRVERIN